MTKLRVLFNRLEGLNTEIIFQASAQVYERFFGNKGKVPKFLGFIPILEEAHWGVFKSNGTEKKACEWIRKVTGRIPEKKG